MVVPGARRCVRQYRCTGRLLGTARKVQKKIGALVNILDISQRAKPLLSRIFPRPPAGTPRRVHSSDDRSRRRPIHSTDTHGPRSSAPARSPTVARASIGPPHPTTPRRSPSAIRDPRVASHSLRLRVRPAAPLAAHISDSRCTRASLLHLVVCSVPPPLRLHACLIRRRGPELLRLAAPGSCWQSCPTVRASPKLLEASPRAELAHGQSFPTVIIMRKGAAGPLHSSRAREASTALLALLARPQL